MNDYNRFLEECRLSDEEVCIDKNVIDHLHEVPGVIVAPSEINGNGLFAASKIEKGTPVIPSRINGEKPNEGRFINHSNKPNTDMIYQNGDTHLISLVEIKTGEEITVDYRNAYAVTHKKNAADLEHALMKMDQAEYQMKHTFANGVYAREMSILAGTALTGAIHRFPCINIVSHGTLICSTDAGTSEMSAPYSFISDAGVKKAIYAVTDCVFTTVHPWEGEEDLDAIEKHFTVSSYEELEEI